MKGVIAEQGTKIEDAAKYRDAAIEAAGVMKGRHQVEKEMAVAAVKAREEDLSAANDAAKARESMLTTAKDKAERDAAAAIARHSEEITAMKAREGQLVAAKEKAEQEAATAAEKMAAILAREGELIAAKETAQKEAKDRSDELAALKAQLQKLSGQQPFQPTVSRDTQQSSSGARETAQGLGIHFDVPLLPSRERTRRIFGEPPLPAATPPDAQPERAGFLVTPVETPSGRRRGSALEDDVRKTKKRAVSTSYLPQRAVEWAVVSSDDDEMSIDETRRPSARPTPYMVGGSSGGFQPVPATPTSATTATFTSGTLEPLASAGAAMGRYSPSSPSQRPPSRFFSRASPAPGSPSQRPLSGLAHQRTASSGLAPGSVGDSSRGPGQAFSGFAPPRDDPTTSFRAQHPSPRVPLGVAAGSPAREPCPCSRPAPRGAASSLAAHQTLSSVAAAPWEHLLHHLAGSRS